MADQGTSSSQSAIEERPKGGSRAKILVAGAFTEFELPRPNSGPGDITAGADGAMWFVELAGRMDGRQPDGNRVGRITLDGAYLEGNTRNFDSFPIAAIVTYDFPARDVDGKSCPPVRMTWYEGGLMPPTPAELAPNQRLPDNGVL